MNMISPFSSWPSFDKTEADAVQRVLLSNRVNYWTGNEGVNFEADFSSWTGTKYAVALANGTVALDLALKALDIKEGDEIIVTPRSFIASVSCVVNAGAIPIFADVERDSGNISANTITPLISARTKAIICVHLAGWPCNMDPIISLAQKHCLYVIEDCAQAHGALYKGKSVGAIGDIGVWSFCQDKIITTGGEGGMVTTNNEMLWKKMWSYKDHGKNYMLTRQESVSSGYKWVHESFGSNFRMTEIQAAIGRIQLSKIKYWTERRNENAKRMIDRLITFCDENGPIRIPKFKCELNCLNFKCKSYPEKCLHAYYKFYVYVRPENLGKNWTRDRVISEVSKAGVPCSQGSCSEIYLEKAFERTGFQPSVRLPVARELGETSLMFLIHPTLDSIQIDKICDIVSEVLLRAKC